MNQQLFDYIASSPSMFHAADTTAKMLEENGFVFLNESADWKLQPGGKYYTTRNGSSLLAWRMPEKDFTCFMVKCH